MHYSDLGASAAWTLAHGPCGALSACGAFNAGAFNACGASTLANGACGSFSACAAYSTCGAVIYVIYDKILK